MKRLLRPAAIVALLALLVIAALFVAVHLSISKPGTTEAIADVREAVDIHFDERLRPYVVASSLHDALLAEGWLHARYRLWQMELLRRAGSGRLAEGLGESMLETDKSLWRAGVPQLAERLAKDASPQTLQHIDAYVAGINAGIESYTVRVPELLLTGITPKPWRRDDVFAVAAIISFQTANNMSKELLRLRLAGLLDEQHFEVFLPDESRDSGFPYVLKDRPLIVAETFLDALNAFEQALMPNASLGSNGWAVSASRSASGNALFAFDSHDALNLPNLFYEVHLFYAPGQSIRGWSLPGLPGVINGFNEQLAWGLTNIGDTQDLYVEHRHATKPDTFKLDGEWYQARTETIQIPVKGRDHDEELKLVYTVNGPLISDDPAISLRWSGHDLRGRGVDSLLAMNTADDWQQFEAAINSHAAPSAAVTYADRAGHIAFRTIGLLPVRGAGRGLLPLAGDESTNQWQGYVPESELPQLFDPAHGYVAAANARVQTGKPLVSADNAPGYRMRRLHQLLASRGDFTLDDMRTMQMDMFNTQAARLLPHMLPERQVLDDTLDSSATDILRDWLDAPLNSADSAGALIWEYWYPELARMIFAAKLNDEELQRLLSESYVLNHALDRLIVDDKNSAWWQGRRETLLRASFSSATTAIAMRHGSDPSAWRWDAAHEVSFRHELHGAVPLLDGWLSRGPYPWGGGHPVLARARYGYNKLFKGRAGATVRVVIEMGDTMSVRAIIPGGQHGHPASKHYDDQLDRWLQGDLDMIANKPDDVGGAVTTLLPVD